MPNRESGVAEDSAQVKNKTDDSQDEKWGQWGTDDEEVRGDVDISRHGEPDKQDEPQK
ncbi:MAG: hypothetical protein WDZ94_05095 [Patescibacteria group bacterium]